MSLQEEWLDTQDSIKELETVITGQRTGSSKTLQNYILWG